MAKLFQRFVCNLLIFIFTFFHLSSSISASVQVRGSREAHDHDHEDSFIEIGNYLLDAELAIIHEERDFSENPHQNITFSEIELLVETVFLRVGCENRVDNCSKCQEHFTEDVFTALGVDPAYGLDEHAFLHASPLLLFGTYDIEAVCQAGPGGTDLSEDAVMNAMKMANDDDGADDTMSESDLDVILEAIHDEYTEETLAQCFDVESIFEESVVDHEAGADDAEILSSSQAVVAGLLQGHCIGEPTMPMKSSFTDAVFDVYATSGVITEGAFETMLVELSIGGDHSDHDHAHAHAVFMARRRRSEIDVGDKRGQSVHKRATVLAEDGHDHAHEHAGHNHSVITVNETCFTGEELLDIFGVDHEAGITETQFNELSPALVQQMLSGACTAAETTPSTITNAEKWGYATLSVFIISMVALLGGLMFPCMSEGVYEKTLQTMIALAVATLTGDALLHLLPQAVGLHAHEAGGEAHSPTSPEMAYVWKCLVVLAAIYAFFVFEQLSSMSSCFKHSHSHANIAPDVEMLPTKNNVTSVSGTLTNGNMRPTESTKELTKYENEAMDDLPDSNDTCFRGCNPVAMMIIFGDSLHNFADGLAIGAAFTLSISAGLSTSIAVFCHELPHELGDLAVLLKQGMRLSTALGLNFLCACTAFIGVWVGIPIAQTDAAREWIFAAIAGMFLYVGLVSMLPMLHQYKGKSSKVSIAILQNIGFLLGIGIMLVIALYEDSITFAI